MIFMVISRKTNETVPSGTASSTADIPLPYLIAGTVALLLLSVGVPLLAPDLLAVPDAPHLLRSPT